MAYLLDTNIVIWAFREVERMPRAFRKILDEEPAYFISVVSLWEISIKQSIKKLDIPHDYIDGLRETAAVFLPIEPAHAEEIRNLPRHHRDPFDRMLIAQARIEGLTILTTDRHFKRYEVMLA